jgi:hypothetical protein
MKTKLKQKGRARGRGQVEEDLLTSKHKT